MNVLAARCCLQRRLPRCSLSALILEALLMVSLAWLLALL